MTNPVKPVSEADLIDSAIFGRPVSRQVVRAYDTGANRDADNADAVPGQVSTVGFGRTVFDGANWHNDPSRADLGNVVVGAPYALAGVNYWQQLGDGIYTLVPSTGGALVVSASLNGLEIPVIEGTPILALGVAFPHVFAGQWFELARASASYLWTGNGTLHGTRPIWPFSAGYHLCVMGIYVTNNAVLRGGNASISLTTFSV